MTHIVKDNHSQTDEFTTLWPLILTVLAVSPFKLKVDVILIY